MSVNKVIIVGHLGRNPEKRFMPNGNPVTTIAVATSEKWKDKDSGEVKESTEWHQIVFFGRIADVAAELLRKGSQVYVEGRINTDKYTDKNGIERYTTKIFANVMQSLDRNNDQQQAPHSNSGQSAYGATKGKRDYQPEPQQRHNRNTSATYDDDDIPF